MEFFQNVKLVTEQTEKGTVYKIVFRVSDSKEDSYLVKAEAIEHLINQYRTVK